ncbi:hypothetical protein [Mariniflexile sp. HMF6888]|uniref:hypothetical protein n=1 Tax=Mariniflexile sp. HMF6888 TaxID=3373086 RepID=UPI00378BF1AD
MFPNSGFSQAELSNDTYYTLYDSFNLYENNDIFNGLEYVDEYKSLKVDNHKFYKSYDFIEGFVIYNEQPYYNIKMKYDLLSDLIVLEFVSKKVNNLSLNSSAVSEFILGGDKFVRLDKNEVLNAFYGNGFFKETYKSDEYTLYVKYLKNKVEKIYDKKIYYVFTDDEVYVLFYKGKYYMIDSKKDILNAVPKREKEILAYYKVGKRFSKNDKGQFLLNLFKNLNSLAN